MSGQLPRKQIDQLPLAEIRWGTDNFDVSNVIGRGGFGYVYKGRLAEYRGHAGHVAVKRLDPGSRQGMFEFTSEISILSVYQHPNLVSLIGYCDDVDEMILVYEYAANGSLDMHLDTGALTWERRLRICIGVATAVEFLHKGIGYHNVIHRDLKSGNILLDENWDAKVTDFGLSKEGPVNQTVTYVISGSAGTHVYIDPEYKESKILRMASDVYSFGVVLFELLCGRMAFVREYSGDEQSLPDLARRCFEEGRIEDIVDPSIAKQIQWSSLSTYSVVAHRCLKMQHEGRPQVSEVLRELQNALKFQERRMVISSLVHNQLEDCFIKDKVLEKQEQSVKSVKDDLVIGQNSLPKAASISITHTKGEQEQQGDDMNLEDSSWEDMLPSDYQEIIKRSSSPVVYTTKKQLFSILSAGVFLDGGKRFIWINKEGKKCLMVPATEFFAEEDPKLSWKLVQNARFPKVADIRLGESQLDIIQKIRIEMLSIDVIYTVYLVYKFVSIASSASESDLKLRCRPHDCNDYIDVVSSEMTSDGWVQAELWNFITFRNDKIATLQLRLSWSLLQGMGRILLQGIDIRCKDTSAMLLKVPHNYKEILQRADSQKDYDKDDLCLVLSRGIQIDNGRILLWLNKDGKTCLLLSAKLLQEKYDWIKPTKTGKLKQLVMGCESGVKWTSFGRSRFTQAAEIEKLKQIVLDGRIDIRLLSPKTRYSVYFVFKYKYHDRTSTRFLRCKFNKQVWTTYRQTKQRADGWFEAMIGNFTKLDLGHHTYLSVRGDDSDSAFVEGIEFRANDVIEL